MHSKYKYYNAVLLCSMLFLKMNSFQWIACHLKCVLTRFLEKVTALVQIDLNTVSFVCVKRFLDQGREQLRDSNVLTFNLLIREHTHSKAPSRNWTPASSIQVTLSVTVAVSCACLQAGDTQTLHRDHLALCSGEGGAQEQAALIFRLWEATRRACFGCLINWWTLKSEKMMWNQTFLVG